MRIKSRMFSFFFFSLFLFLIFSNRFYIQMKQNVLEKQNKNNIEKMPSRRRKKKILYYVFVEQKQQRRSRKKKERKKYVVFPFFFSYLNFVFNVFSLRIYRNHILYYTHGRELVLYLILLFE